ncbi:transcriptional regulator [Enterovibrio norvegicus FF-33]|uniref:helix-turn-helix domain-containing protein n=1 Tax=Enterovibrio norvegicus TaxID=188144 RepID=UPI0002EB9443|nr:helix-turn-helix transcriptional regulator [Enterovibrio norvegicus]OEE69815.1 transcriptional regulator [Enterovibrio norvegicus FF-33]OEE85723.1 transcriptional regulator [Enterovibrio norvegicus FF-162]
MNEELLIGFGQHVRTLRQKLEISQEELAANCGLDRTYISGIERGKRNVSLINIFRLAEALGSTPSALLDFSFGVTNE